MKIRESEEDNKQRTPDSAHQSSKVSKESVDMAQGRHDQTREWK